MFNDEENAHVILLLDDLQTDLRNGNVPEAEKLIATLICYLTNKQPLGWQMLMVFIIAHLQEVETRLALLHFLPKLQELISPFQPDQEADS